VTTVIVADDHPLYRDALARAVEEREGLELVGQAADGPEALTERKLEILELTAAGKSGPEIAKALGLSPGTVKTHLRHIYEKFGVSDRAAAVAEAMKRGMLVR
jgi:two-component system nitrate/nitrite response regulator NarL